VPSSEHTKFEVSSGEQFFWKMDLLVLIPLVYLSMYFLSTTLIEADTGKTCSHCWITVVARLPQGLDYRSSQLILSDEFVGIYYHYKYFKYGTCLEPE
jgi:hypothetical protein